MKFLERPYYVALLNAAAYHGASHQQPLESFVTTTFPVLRSMQKKGLKLNYVCAREQVEQDLVICRALVEIFSDDWLASSLAFRGGTALHKLYLNPQPRYSEDIDLVQVRAKPIKETGC